MEHHFNVEVATKYGMLEAVLLEHFYFWIQKNEANKVNYQDGMYWTYSSIAALCELFPYASESKIKTALKHLKEEGLLLTGNYNKNSYDHTTWYALTDEGISAQTIETTDLLNPTNRLGENDQSNSKKSPIEGEEIANRSGVYDRPIPYIRTDKRTDKSSIYLALMESYNSTCTSLPKAIKMTDERRRHLKARLESHSEDDIKMAFVKAEESDFLSGREKDWHANFDWIIKKENNLVKILEGHYDNRDHDIENLKHRLTDIYAGGDEEKMRHAYEVLK